MTTARLYIRGVFFQTVPIATIYDNKWLAVSLNEQTFRFNREQDDPQAFICDDEDAFVLLECDYLKRNPPKPLRRPKRLSPAHLRLLQKMDKIRENLRRADNGDTTEP